MRADRDDFSSNDCRALRFVFDLFAFVPRRHPGRYAGKNSMHIGLTEAALGILSMTYSSA